MHASTCVPAPRSHLERGHADSCADPSQCLRTFKPRVESINEITVRLHSMPFLRPEAEHGTGGRVDVGRVGRAPLEVGSLRSSNSPEAPPLRPRKGRHNHTLHTFESFASQFVTPFSSDFQPARSRTSRSKRVPTCRWKREEGAEVRMWGGAYVGFECVDGRAVLWSRSTWRGSEQLARPPPEIVLGTRTRVSGCHTRGDHSYTLSRMERSRGLPCTRAPATDGEREKTKPEGLAAGPRVEETRSTEVDVGSTGR